MNTYKIYFIIIFLFFAVITIIYGQNTAYTIELEVNFECIGHGNIRTCRTLGNVMGR